MEKELLVFQHSRDAMLLVHMDGTIIHANPAASQLYGYTVDKLCSIKVSQLRIPQETKLISAQLDTAYKQGLLFETVHVHADGHLIPVEVNSVKISLDGTDMLLSIIRDITERQETLARQQKAYEQLYDIKEQFKVTLESIGDAVIATDVNSKITLMNAVSEELTGWMKSEAIGKPITKVFKMSPNYLKNTEHPVAEVLKSGKIVSPANHTLLIAKDGTQKAIAHSAAPIISKDGAIPYVSG